jgi:thioredoxin
LQGARNRPYNVRMNNNVIEINDANFDAEVVNAATPVLVDFSAEWCGPCKKLAPIVADLALQYDGRIKVGHLDVEGSPATAAQFGVMSVPTLIFFKSGKAAEQLIGSVSRQVLEQTIRKVIG